jgi:hypothetical protein
MYFKPLLEGAAEAAPATTTTSPKMTTAAPSMRWEWTPLAKLVVGLFVIAVLAAIFVFAAHRRSATTTTQTNPIVTNRQFFEQIADELNKLAPYRVNEDAEFAQADVNGIGFVFRFNLLRVNKTQITRSGGIPNSMKYARSFLCKTATSRAALDKGFLITSEYFDSDGLKVTSFPVKSSDCVW